MKKPKNSRSAVLAPDFVDMSAATFLFREKQEQKEEPRCCEEEKEEKRQSAAVPTARAVPADANTNLTIGDIIIIM